MDVKIFRLLKSEQLRGKGRMVGFLTDPKIDELITMASLNKRVGKSSLFREIVKYWLKATKTNRRSLIYYIAEHCYKIWVTVYSMTGQSDDHILVNFKKELRQDLGSRKITDGTIDKIIAQFDKLKNEAE